MGHFSMYRSNQDVRNCLDILDILVASIWLYIQVLPLYSAPPWNHFSDRKDKVPELWNAPVCNPGRGLTTTRKGNAPELLIRETHRRSEAPIPTSPAKTAVMQSFAKDTLYFPHSLATSGATCSNQSIKLLSLGFAIACPPPTIGGI
jgi:hypothetical protein